VNRQLRLPIDDTEQVDPDASYRERLDALLSKNLDFHDQQSTYASHNFHAFPAKFPPQLPRAFINALTDPGDVVLDPMMGSGTTILEAFLLDRQGIGFDIDPARRLRRPGHAAQGTAG
jgi:DNA modification methylase